jgi:uncharacterized protein (TIGR02996 family)
MTPREALLQAIIADPDDDALRLVYADYLEETGDPVDAARAELIRFQIATERLPDGDPAKSDRITEAVRLTDRYKKVWFSWVRDEGCLAYPRRGFLDHWSCGAKAAHQADLADAFRQEPITDATLFPKGSDLPKLAGWPQFARLRTLKLWPGAPAEDEVLAFLSSPHLTGLQEFEYMGRRATRVPLREAVRLLASRPEYAGLRSLTIQAAGLGDLGASALANSTTLARLTTLALAHCDVGPAGCGELLSSPVVAAVTNLHLGGSANTAAGGEALAASLASSPHLRRLQHLTLDETAVTDRAAAQLARADWPGLTSLVLVPRDLNDSTASTGLPTMTTAGLESLTAARWFAAVEALDLSGHPLGDSGARVLALARLPRLRCLTLMMTGLTAVGLEELVEAYAGQLTQLQLYGNPLGDAGAELLANAAWPRMVWEGNFDLGLFLGGCGIGDLGAKALLQSRTIPTDIPSLFLGRGAISYELIEALKAKYPRAKIQF